MKPRSIYEVRKHCKGFRHITNIVRVRCVLVCYAVVDCLSSPSQGNPLPTIQFKFFSGAGVGTHG